MGTRGGCTWAENGGNIPDEKECASMREHREQEQSEQVNHPVFRTIIGALPGGRWLIHPLTVLIEYYDDEVVVSEPRFHMHASAPTEEEALAAFRRIFSGYLDVLTKREKTLVPPLLDQLNYLRSVIAS